MVFQWGLFERLTYFTLKQNILIHDSWTGYEKYRNNFKGSPHLCNVSVNEKVKMGSGVSSGFRAKRPRLFHRLFVKSNTVYKWILDFLGEEGSIVKNDTATCVTISEINRNYIFITLSHM